MRKHLDGLPSQRELTVSPAFLWRSSLATLERMETKVNSASQRENEFGDHAWAEAKLGPGSSVRSFVGGLVLENIDREAGSPPRSFLGRLPGTERAENSLETPWRIHVGAHVWAKAKYRAHVSLQRIDSGVLVWAEVRWWARERKSVFRRRSFCGVKMA